MFDNLRHAFREAVDNFKEELGRDEIPEAVDRLLREMKREAADTKAEIRRLEEAIHGAIEGAEKEKRAAAGKSWRSTSRMRTRLAWPATMRRSTNTAGASCNTRPSR